MYNIPHFSEYKNFEEINYKVDELKIFCRYFKLKLGGKKSVLIKRLREFYFRSYFSLKIQKRWRNFITNKYNLLRGPALLKRDICVNDTDFLTLEKINTVLPIDFFSFKDKNNQIYGFEFASIYNLMIVNKQLTNPYNRQLIPENVVMYLKKILKLAPLFNDKINLTIETIQVNTYKKQFELKILSLCSEMDNLGNYTDVSWFTNLSRVNIITYIRELADIWFYRAQLTNEIKIEICPPSGNPFFGLNLNILPSLSNDMLKMTMLKIINKLINTSHIQNNRALGANYVLCALTLVNVSAAESMPWLYQSVAHD
tara:strand:+ start:22138 stop:23076 length:939 start_codon:yes stop_codon:yes gene_type:complete